MAEVFRQGGGGGFDLYVFAGTAGERQVAVPIHEGPQHRPLYAGVRRDHQVPGGSVWGWCGKLPSIQDVLLSKATIHNRTDEKITVLWKLTHVPDKPCL